MTDAIRDQNHVPVALGRSSTDATVTIPFQVDPITGRLLTDNAGGGSGTVTSVSVVTANGFAGSVATATTTPAITLSTTVTGIIKGDGTGLSAASASTDYAAVAFKTISVSGQSDVVADSPIDTLTLAAGTNISITTNAGTDTITISATGVGTGDVVGPSSATDNAIARFDGTTGKLIQNSVVTIADTTGNIAGFQVLTFTGSSSGTTSLTATAAASGALTLPAATDTLIGKATTDTLTNKTYDTAGTGNSFSINGVAVTANTGTGAVARATSPTFVTPVLGAATATSINGLTITSSTGVLTITNGKTLSVSNTLTFTGTDSSSVAFGAGGTVLYTNSTIPLTVGTTTITSGTNTRILYNNSGVLGEYTLTGSGTVVAMQTAPTFVTSITVPKIIGGSGTTGTQLTLQTTSGNGTTDALVITGGNNGGTTFATFTTGALSLGTSAVFTTGTIELGAASDTTLSRSSAGVLAVEGVVIPSISSTNTLTNKRVTRRVSAVTQSATPTMNTDNMDIAEITGLAQAITSMTTNLSGTPVDGDLLEIQITDNGTARAITWGTSFANGGLVNLPTTTVISTMLRVLLEYQTTASLNKWVCVAVA